jgi:3-oxoacyl-[acyl-carrier-protein] synthase-3
MMKQLLEKSHMDKNQIDFFLFHQANKYMLNTIRKVCGIEKDKFYIDIEQTGNTVSPTILIGMKECLDKGMIHPGMKIMVCGFGVGLSYAATLISMI